MKIAEWVRKQAQPRCTINHRYSQFNYKYTINQGRRTRACQACHGMPCCRDTKVVGTPISSRKKENDRKRREKEEEGKKKEVGKKRKKKTVDAKERIRKN